MADIGDHAIQLFEIIVILLGLLFIVIQILIRQDKSTIQPGILIELIKTILLAMFFLVVAAFGVAWVFIHETDPNLIFPVGLITFSLGLILVCTAYILRLIMRGSIFVNE